jgi:hypothetical protein
VHSDESVSGSAEVVAACLGFDQIADVADGMPERIKRSGLSFAQVRFHLGEDLFNRFAMMPLNDCFLVTFSRMA